MTDNTQHQDDALRALLKTHLGDDIGNVDPLGGGFFSRAFAVSAAGRECVIRLNMEVHAQESFAKDDYAWRHFASPALPIARIAETGATSDGYYAISERAPGRLLHDCSATQRDHVRPNLLDIVEAIGRTNTGSSAGYGDWGSDGNGQFASWHDFLASMMADYPDGYDTNWHRLFHDSFLERDLFEAGYRKMLQHSTACPNVRGLVHSDLHVDNILSDGERITGILDWANALYGDPLYDIAWLTWQAAHPGWWYDDGAQLLRARFGATPHYAERLACYQFHIGLDHLRFYARTANRDGYNFCRAWLLALLATDPEA